MQAIKFFENHLLIHLHQFCVRRTQVIIQARDLGVKAFHPAVEIRILQRNAGLLGKRVQKGHLALPVGLARSLGAQPQQPQHTLSR